VVQPPRLYERQELRTFTDFTPLNRLDDAVPPESDTAREFNQIAKRIALGKADAQEWQPARQWLVLWRDNDAKLQPSLARSYLTQDLAPVSRNLSRVAEIGLQTLDNLHSNCLVSIDLRQRNIEISEIRRQTAGSAAAYGGAFRGIAGTGDQDPVTRRHVDRSPSIVLVHSWCTLTCKWQHFNATGSSVNY
jgi:hypothetical protein